MLPEIHIGWFYFNGSDHINTLTKACYGSFSFDWNRLHLKRYLSGNLGNLGTATFLASLTRTTRPAHARHFPRHRERSAAISPCTAGVSPEICRTNSRFVLFAVATPEIIGIIISQPITVDSGVLVVRIGTV